MSKLLALERLVQQRLFAVVHILGNQHIMTNGDLINYLQVRGAARKGKRIERVRKARANAARRRLLEAQNPKKKKRPSSIKVDKEQLRFNNEREADMNLPDPPEDDVYFTSKFKKKKLSLEEILELHRQTAHPDVFNLPDALVSATIELNLKMKIKRKRYIERIESTVLMPHLYNYQLRARKIIALCKNVGDQEAAKEAGAIMAGSADIANLLKTNQLTYRDFDHLVCHTDYMQDFAAVKGMKGQPFFPSQARGNFGENIVDLVKYFKDGVDYRLKRSQDAPEYGYIESHFGRLDMTTDQLRENLLALFHSINRFRPLNLIDGKQFFERVLITSAASSEVFLLRFWDLMDDYVDPVELIKEDDKKEANRAKA